MKTYKESYQCQQQIYQQMLVIAETQHQLCQTADFSDPVQMNRLRELVDQRQQFITAIELEQRLLDELTDSTINWDGDVLAAEKEQLSTILGEIQRIDGETASIFAQKLQGVQTELQKLQSGKKGSKAYNPFQQQSGGYFIDKKK